MLAQEEKIDVCQISLTGSRSLAMLGLLVKEPRSFSEIKAKFVEQKLTSSENSDDIIRIDMNTLRAIGCEISRACAKTNYKYKLLSHPFGIQITQDDVNILKRAYNIVTEDADISVLVDYHNLLDKLANSVFDEKIKEQIYGISILKRYSLNAIEEYINDCNAENVLEIKYKDAGNNKIVYKTFIPNKINLRSGKLYIFGYDIQSKENVMVPINRIISVLSRKTNETNINQLKPVEVKFFLKNFNAAGIEEGEEILESNEDLSQIIRGKYHNEFIAVQRMLSFGPACTVLEPLDIREKVINKLLEMKEVYKNG